MNNNQNVKVTACVIKYFVLDFDGSSQTYWKEM